MTDGSLDRSKLRDIIFNDNKQRKRLEAILHPRIRTEVFKQANALGGDYCLIVVPLLFETNYPYPVDRVLVVNTPENEQLSRLLARDDIDKPTAEAIIASQISPEERLNRADDVINNDGSIDAIKNKIDKLHHQYLVLSNTSSSE